MLHLAVVGAGRWGSRVLSAFQRAENVQVRSICDADDGTAGRQRGLYPAATVTTDFREVLADPKVSAIALATPTVTHCEMSLAALRAGKDVFVEKPLATSVGDALRIRREVLGRGRRLMVGHLLQYHPAVVELRRLVESGELGAVRLVFAQRCGARPNPDVDAWWLLAPHDVSLLRFILGREPACVEAVERSDGVRLARLHYDDGCRALLSVTSTSRHKVRHVAVVGTRLTAVFDDTRPSGKLRLYRAGKGELWRRLGAGVGLSQVGEVTLPGTEPLLAECQHFVDSLLTGSAIRSDIHDGLAVTRVLESGARSAADGGRLVLVQSG